MYFLGMNTKRFRTSLGFYIMKGWTVDIGEIMRTDFSNTISKEHRTHLFTSYPKKTNAPNIESKSMEWVLENNGVTKIS